MTATMKTNKIAKMSSDMTRIVQHPYRKCLAFTLIQLMIVIALATAVTVYTFQSNSGHIQAVKTKKVAVEIQHYLQASIEYYKKHSAWPTTLTQLFNDNLIPAFQPTQGANANPWSYAYELHPINGEQGDDFEIITEIPTLQISQQLSRMLPNVTIANGKIHAKISNRNKDNSLIFVGTERSATSKTVNQCASTQTGCLPLARQQHFEQLCKQYGRTADYVVGLQSFNAGKVPGWSEFFEFFGAASYYDFYDLFIRKNTDQNRWGFTLQMKRQSDPGVGNDGQAVMFIYCKPADVQGTGSN